MLSQGFSVLVGCATLVLLANTVHADLTINTPTGLATCLPSAISWSDAVPPVIISAYPKGDTSKEPYALVAKSDQASGSFSWTVNLPAGTTTTLGIRDHTGNVQATAPVTIYQSPEGTDACKLVTPYDGGGNTVTHGDGSTSSGSGNSTAPASGGSGNSGGNNSTSSGSKSPATHDKNTTATATPKETTGNSTLTSTSSADNKTTPAGPTSGAPDTDANDAPANLWVGSSEQNYILIISILLCTAMAAMIGAWSE